MGMFSSQEISAFKPRFTRTDLAVTVPDKPLGIPSCEMKFAVSPTIVRFTIPQAAMGAPRMTRRDKWKHRPCVLAYHAWCDLIRDCCPNPPKPEETAVVRVDAFYKPPASWSKRKADAAIGKRKRTRPDPDNVAKSIFDALWKQDAAIGEIQAARWWGEEDSTVVTIELEARP